MGTTTDEELRELVAAVAADVAARVAAQLAGPGRAADAAVPRQEPQAVFRREGEYWTLRYAGRTVHLRDSRGLQHLARLLDAPGEPVHVLALVAGAGGRSAAAGDAPLGLDEGRGEPVLDLSARVAYRERLRALDAELDAAAHDGDLGRTERASAERDALLGELSRAVGLGGRDRTLGSPTERARVAVSKAVRVAIGHVAEHHAELGEHLASTVRTGTYCCYTAQDRPTWAC